MDSLTRDEHYREAVEFDADAARMFVENPVKALLMAQRAQTHATLALVAERGGVVEARVHDDHGPGFDPWCTACVEDAADRARESRESRECVLVCIGVFKPKAWDWSRLEDEFTGRFGLAIEDASVPQLGQFRAYLLQLQREPAAGDGSGSVVPPW